MVVKAKVVAVDIFGAIVQFASGVKALCPLRHMSEFEIAKPRKKFQVVKYRTFCNMLFISAFSGQKRLAYCFSVFCLLLIIVSSVNYLQVGVECVFRVLGCKSKRITVTHKKTLVCFLWLNNVIKFTFNNFFISCAWI